MRQHALGRHRQERRRETGIDTRGEAVDGLRPIVERREHLLLALVTMLEITVNDFFSILDRNAMRREEA